MDWMLITNPDSKNTLIRKMWGNYSWKVIANYKDRYESCYTLAAIHIIGMFIAECTNDFVSFWNILVNVYPVLIQVYIGIRLHRVCKFKNSKYNIITA